jgi:hypothetical protein
MGFKIPFFILIANFYLFLFSQQCTYFKDITGKDYNPSFLIKAIYSKITENFDISSKSDLQLIFQTFDKNSYYFIFSVKNQTEEFFILIDYNIISRINANFFITRNLSFLETNFGQKIDRNKKILCTDFKCILNRSCKENLNCQNCPRCFGCKNPNLSFLENNCEYIPEFGNPFKLIKNNVFDWNEWFSPTNNFDISVIFENKNIEKMTYVLKIEIFKIVSYILIEYIIGTSQIGDVFVTREIDNIKNIYKTLAFRETRYFCPDLKCSFNNNCSSNLFNNYQNENKNNINFSGDQLKYQIQNIQSNNSALNNNLLNPSIPKPSNIDNNTFSNINPQIQKPSNIDNNTFSNINTQRNTQNLSTNMNNQLIPNSFVNKSSFPDNSITSSQSISNVSSTLAQLPLRNINYTNKNDNFNVNISANSSNTSLKSEFPTNVNVNYTLLTPNTNFDTSKLNIENKNKMNHSQNTNTNTSTSFNFTPSNTTNRDNKSSSTSSNIENKTNLTSTPYTYSPSNYSSPTSATTIDNKSSSTSSNIENKTNFTPTPYTYTPSNYSSPTSATTIDNKSSSTSSSYTPSAFKSNSLASTSSTHSPYTSTSNVNVENKSSSTSSTNSSYTPYTSISNLNVENKTNLTSPSATPFGLSTPPSQISKGNTSDLNSGTSTQTKALFADRKTINKNEIENKRLTDENFLNIELKEEPKIQPIDPNTLPPIVYDKTDVLKDFTYIPDFLKKEVETKNLIKQLVKTEIEKTKEPNKPLNSNFNNISTPSYNLPYSSNNTNPYNINTVDNSQDNNDSINAIVNKIYNSLTNKIEEESFKGSEASKIEAERKKLEEERRKIEEQRKYEEKRKYEEEMRRLENEKKIIENQKSQITPGVTEDNENLIITTLIDNKVKQFKLKKNSPNDQFKVDKISDEEFFITRNSIKLGTIFFNPLKFVRETD